MKPRYTLALIAAALLAPALSQARTSQPVTRAQVRDEVIALVTHGYDANRDDYPVTLQRAQAALARQQNGGHVPPRT